MFLRLSIGFVKNICDFLCIFNCLICNRMSETETKRNYKSRFFSIAKRGLHFCNPLFIFKFSLTTSCFIWWSYLRSSSSYSWDNLQSQRGFDPFSSGFSCHRHFCSIFNCILFNFNADSSRCRTFGGIFRLANSLFTQTASNIDHLSFAYTRKLACYFENVSFGQTQKMPKLNILRDPPGHRASLVNEW